MTYTKPENKKEEEKMKRKKKNTMEGKELPEHLSQLNGLTQGPLIRGHGVTLTDVSAQIITQQ